MTSGDRQNTANFRNPSHVEPLGYLKKALKALVGQTLERDEFEVIVVDDGSTDATHQVVDLFKEDLQLTYLYQENAGIAVAKNRGIEQARAPILLFMDDDDIASPGLLEEHLRSHARYPDPAIAVLGRTDLSSPIVIQARDAFCDGGGFLSVLLSHYPAGHNGLITPHFWGGRSSCKTAVPSRPRVFQPGVPLWL